MIDWAPCPPYALTCPCPAAVMPPTSLTVDVTLGSATAIVE